MGDQNASITVEVYSDVVCPWCYVGKRRWERAQSQFPTAAQVIWRPFQLNPTMPEEGMDRRIYLEAKFGSQASYHRLEEQVAAAGASEGISFAFETMRKTPNTFLAHRLIWYAGQHDRQNSVVDALFKAYFELGADIGSQAVLADLAASAGLEAARFLQTEEGAANVKAEEVAGRRLGIRAVPYFLLNKSYGISGAQPVDVFIGAIKSIGVLQVEDQLTRK